jgi:phosphatidate phosphatase PAH1
MRILIPLLLLLLMPVWSFADTPINRDIDYQVSEILNEVAGIKPGMTTRGELFKYFTTEGGLYVTTQRTYVSKRCSCVKVDVKFILTRPDEGPDGLSTDVIKSISKPYLDSPHID